jgi:hypothetical protein
MLDQALICLRERAGGKLMGAFLESAREAVGAGTVTDAKLREA